MMVSLDECVRVAGLPTNRFYLGVSPSARHLSLLSSYLMNADRGMRFVREMIIADLHAFSDLGAQDRAADALIVLRLLLAQFPLTASADVSELRPGAEASARAPADRRWRDRTHGEVVPGRRSQPRLRLAASRAD